MEECSLKKRDKIIREITKMSNRMRKKVLEMALAAGSDSSHFGGAYQLLKSQQPSMVR